MQPRFRYDAKMFSQIRDRDAGPSEPPNRGAIRQLTASVRRRWSPSEHFRRILAAQQMQWALLNAAGQS